MSKGQTARVGILDKVAGWLDNRSRLSRILLTVISAALATAATALPLFSVFSSPDAVVAPDVVSQRVSLTFTVLFGVGLAAYIFGWYVLVGFGDRNAKRRSGRLAAIWVLLMPIMLLFVGVGLTIWITQAIR